ncbi:hypothetical protein TNCV_3523871 [Trichonephila clavipes]|uniref:Uncharacterized protein n=1 Tax=Trichonephila clavipes TaxID=2585209 RepID=A0A8X6SDM1_TRICX|nr:hypothetical protein TNCV_3523871 [Trichonephila clavipes]
MDSYRFDLMSFQEMRWIGQGIQDGRNHIVFCSCDPKEPMFGLIATEGLIQLSLAAIERRATFTNLCLKDTQTFQNVRDKSERLPKP